MVIFYLCLHWLVQKSATIPAADLLVAEIHVVPQARASDFMLITVL